MSRTAQAMVQAGASYARFIVSVAVVFLLTPRIIAVLGREAFGLWSLVFAVLGIVGLLDLGLQTSVVKFVAECRGAGDRARRNQILSTVAVMYAGLALLAGMSIALLAPHFNDVFAIPSAQRRPAVALLWILGARIAFVGLPFGLLRGLLFAEQRILALNIIQAVSALAYGTAAWIAIGNGVGLVGLAWLNLAVTFIEHAAYGVWAFGTIPELRIVPRIGSRQQFREVLSFSGHQLVVNVTGLIRLRSDPFIVKFFLPLSAVAIYTVGQKVAENLHLLVKQGVNVLAPLAAELQGGGEASKLRYLLLSGVKFGLAPAVAFSIICLVLGRDAIVAWVGTDFVDAAPVLVILMMATAIGTIETTTASVLAMTGYHRPAARAAGLSAVLNVVVSLLLVQVLGLAGVALGTLVATIAIDAYLVPHLACRAYDIPVRTFVHRVLYAAVLPGILELGFLMGLKLWLQPTSLAVLGLIAVSGLAVYAIAFWMYGLTRDERVLLRGHMVGAARGLWSRRPAPVEQRV